MESMKLRLRNGCFGERTTSRLKLVFLERRTKTKTAIFGHFRERKTVWVGSCCKLLISVKSQTETASAEDEPHNSTDSERSVFGV